MVRDVIGRNHLVWDQSLSTLDRFLLSMWGKSILLYATPMPRGFATAHYQFVISKPWKVSWNWIAFCWYSFCYIKWFDPRQSEVVQASFIENMKKFVNSNIVTEFSNLSQQVIRNFLNLPSYSPSNWQILKSYECFNES